jgi:predicted lysophospholipase L1 biosynthesis ABC-type transport system permease subunit
MELATLSGRGFSPGQITGVFARATGLLTLLAVSVSPLVAYWLLVLWSNWQGYAAPNMIPSGAWWLAMITGLFGWIFLIVSIYRAARQIDTIGQGQGLSYHQRILTQRHWIWDVFILTLGGLAYWQLTQGSVIMNEINPFSAEIASGISDLVLLLGPSLLLLAMGLIIIRFLPLIWRFFARVSREGRGLVWTLVFTRLARQPVGPSQVTLLISMTAGLAFFASIFSFSIGNWQQTMARYVVGADIRIRQPSIEPAENVNLPEATGVIGMTQVIRARTTFLVDEYQRLDFDLLAVDPDTFASVVSNPPEISPFSMDQIMRVLRTNKKDVPPIIISSTVNTSHLNIGDLITMELGDQTYPFEIVGIIINFPLLDGAFAITDLSRFAKEIDLDSMVLMDLGSRETWLSVESDAQERIIAKLTGMGFEESIVGNSREQLDAFQNNLVFREVTTAFGLNALILIPLSVIGFLLILLFSAQGRVGDFDILQAIGFSNSQLRSLLIREGLLFITLGILIGIGIGFGLAFMMQSFLSQILPSLRDGIVLENIFINWSDLGVRFLALIGFYSIGLLLLTISVFRNQRSAEF